MNGDLVPAEPVLDGELVGEPKTLVRRLGSGWRRVGVSPHFKSSRLLQCWSKDTIGWLVRLPGRFVGGVGRGAVVAARAWRRWVRVRDYREAAEQSEKLADKFVEIRALTLFRWKVTGAVA
ncbi:cell division protein FtsK, partial [Actinosynnema sp. NPDC059797]